HVGSLAQILTLVRFQRAGHKPVALIGGATGMIGDPSGKSQERNLLSEDILQKNLAGIQKQLEKYLDFKSGANSAEIVNNYDWFKTYSFLDFIRDVGKHITVNYMSAKDSVKKRLESEVGMSFTEFSYQLIQGFDFYYLWKEKNCMLQMGGSDQWGNIVTGTELIRKKGGGNAFALTTQLIKKSDGSKFGKTEGGNIWLDPKKTSPYQFYQFWFNATDEDVKSWIRIFSFKSKQEIEALEKEHDSAPHLRILQKALAEEMTILTHSLEAWQTAVKTSEFLFGAGSLDFLHSLDDEGILQVFEGIAQYQVSKHELTQGIIVTDLLADRSPVFSSKGEARKMIQGGGVSINREKVSDATQVYNSSSLINDKYLVVQKGKKNYFLIIAE
ncbi:MAG TPA: tyrosine--tRNA ligase, partial [Sphingobacteriaceae bacterium]